MAIGATTSASSVWALGSTLRINIQEYNGDVPAPASYAAEADVDLAAISPMGEENS